MSVYIFGERLGYVGTPRLTAAEPAEEARRTLGPAEAGAGAVARCCLAGRAAGSAEPAVSALSAAAPPRGPCRGRGPLRGPSWTPGSVGRSTGTETSSGGPSSSPPPPAVPGPQPSASSTWSWRGDERMHIHQCLACYWQIYISKTLSYQTGNLHSHPIAHTGLPAPCTSRIGE